MFDFNKKIKGVPGQITEAESIFLYETAKEVKAGNVIVEIGSWKGKSTVCLAAGSKKGNKVKVFAIDPHIYNTFEIFRQNINKAGVMEYIEPIKDTSENVAQSFNRPVEFIFIDGNHHYKFVRLDFELWFPKVINGGILAFHDSWHDRFIGPNLVTAILLLTSSKIKSPRLIDTTTAFTKVKKNSLLNRFENILFLIYRTLFGIRGFLRLKRQCGKRR